MMSDSEYKIESIEPFCAEIITIADEEWKNHQREWKRYQRDSNGNWMVLMGESWEDIGDNKYLEAAYQQFKQQSKGDA